MQAKDQELSQLKERVDQMGEVILNLNRGMEFLGKEVMTYINTFGTRPLAREERKGLEQLKEKLRPIPDSENDDDND